MLCRILTLVLVGPLLATSFNLDTHFPIVYEDPQILTAKRPTYFGYAVLTHRKNNITWIQIGAPRGADSLHPEIVEPGLIYRCPIGNHCVPYYVDTTGNKKSKSDDKIHDKKDMGWLGATMALNDEADVLVVCAPRCKNQIKKSVDKMQGVCYSDVASRFNNEKNVTAEKLIPLIDHDTMKYYGQNIHHNQLGQAGISAHFVNEIYKNKVEVIIGAPGVLNWRGSIILLSDTAKRTNGAITRRKRDIEWNGKMENVFIPDPNIPGVFFYDYFGYSVSSGNFFSKYETLYVSGSPRANSLRGKVTLFKYPKRTGDSLDIIQMKLGEVVGGYFGGNLHVNDVNNDGLDDLLVASPMLVTPCVFIYLGNQRGSLEDPPPSLVLKSKNEWGRNNNFGAAIAAEDIDVDGYKEVLIGVPHAESKNGLVAIWKGSEQGPNGLNGPYITLRAAEFNPNLRGFGSSIANPKDLDGNLYPEVTIGSYLSGHTVLLRGRPIVKLEVDFEADHVIRILPNVKYFYASICIYSNPSPTVPIKINREISLDSTFRRIYFFPTIMEHKRTDFIEMTNETYCTNFSIAVKDNNRNAVDALIISVNATVIDYTIQKTPILIKKDEIIGNDVFNKWYPKSEKIEKELKIPFVTGCDEDKICRSDLKVYAYAKNKSIDVFMLGSSTTFQLEVEVKNTNNPAYLTQVRVFLPAGTTLARQPSNCEIISNDEILCNMANPLFDKMSKSITIDVDMNTVSENVNIQVGDRLTFKVEAISNSEEILPDDNLYYYNLSLGIDADVKVAGKSLETVVYHKDEHNESNEYITFQHFFEVQKFGVSPANKVLLSLSVPYLYVDGPNVEKIVDIYQPQGYQNGQPFTCTADDITFLIDEKVEIPESLFVVEETEKKREKRSVLSRSDEIDSSKQIKDQALRSMLFDERGKFINDVTMSDVERKLPANRTVRISCDQDKIKCQRIKCSVGPFRQSQTFARLLLVLKLNVSMLKEHMKLKDIYVYKSEGSVMIEETSNPNYSSTVVTSILVGSPPENEIELWLIIISIILGILLLILVTIGLVKAGFFERKKKKELAILRQASQRQKNKHTKKKEAAPPENPNVIAC